MKIFLRFGIILFLLISGMPVFAQKCIKTLSGHSNVVSSLAFMPGSKYLASGSWDKTIKIWNVQTGAVLKTIEGSRSIILDLAYTPDGKKIASSGWDQTIRFYDATTAQLLKEIYPAHFDKINSISYNVTGSFIASASSDTITIWETQNYTRKFNLKGHTDIVNCVSYSPDGEILASGSWDRTLRLWDAQDGKNISVLKGHNSTINDLCFTPDGSYVLSCSEDGTMILWDTETDERVTAFLKQFPGVNCMAISPEGKYIALGLNDNSVVLMEYYTENIVSTLKGHTKAITDVCFSPSGDFLATASEDHSIKLWDMTELKYQRCIEEKLFTYAALGQPKAPNETNEQYNRRITEYNNKKEVAKKACIQEDAILKKEIQNSNNQQKTTGVVFERVSLSIDEISAYNSTTQLYIITVEGKKMGLKMPPSEASSFNTLWKSAQVDGLRKTLLPQKTNELINLAVIHPTSKTKYPVGKQLSPSDDPELKKFLENRK